MSLATAKLQGPASRQDAVALLDELVIPLRLATVTRSGWPVVLSLWFLRDGDEIVCATQRSSAIVRALEHAGRCAFEVAPDAPPYRGVRGRATVAVTPDDELAVLARLIDRYLGARETPFARWLLGRTTPEVVLRLDPTELTTWDYTGRMTTGRRT